MDSLTHIALGAAVGTAVLGRKVGARAALWGAVCGTLPDLDVLVPYGDPVRDFTFHRAESHSLFWLSVVSPFLAWIIARLQRSAGASFREWWLLTWLALVTHPLLDSFTVYGTQLLLPFSDYPIGTGSVFIIDPLYTVPLIVGVVAALRLRTVAPDRAMRWNAAGLALSTLYLGWGLAAQAHVEGVVHRTLAATPLAHSRALVTPAPFNTLLWRVVVMDEGGYREGYYSLLDDSPYVQFERHASDPTPARAAAGRLVGAAPGLVHQGVLRGDRGSPGNTHRDGFYQQHEPVARTRRDGRCRRIAARAERRARAHDRPAHGPDAVVRVLVRRGRARRQRGRPGRCAAGAEPAPAGHGAAAALGPHLGKIASPATPAAGCSPAGRDRR